MQIKIKEKGHMRKYVPNHDSFVPLHPYLKLGNVSFPSE